MTAKKLGSYGSRANQLEKSQFVISCLEAVILADLENSNKKKKVSLLVKTSKVLMFLDVSTQINLEMVAFLLYFHSI